MVQFLFIEYGTISHGDEGVHGFIQEIDSMQNIEKRYKEAKRLLDSYSITPAITAISSMLAETDALVFASRLEGVRENYRYLTKYLVDGKPDSTRSDQLSGIVCELRGLADCALRAYKKKDSPEYYYSLLRFNNFRNERLSGIAEEYGKVSAEMSLAELGGNDVTGFRKKREECLARLFNTLFTSYGVKSEYDDLTKYVNSGYADNNVIGQSLSAMTLSLLQFYESSKLWCLLDVYDNSEDPSVLSKALTGIMLALACHPERIKEDRKVMNRLTLWKDDSETSARLKSIVRSIVGTRDTERVATKLKEDVIPELMRLRPEILKTLKENPEEIESFMMEGNPEWGAGGKLAEKLKEFSEMQQEGADLMMVSFANLKQFDFFKEASNWFLPFDPHHSGLGLDDKTADFLEQMKSMSDTICDSDMYSLALATSKMPVHQKEMIQNQFSAQLQNLKELNESRTVESSRPKFDSEAVKCVRELYRFFKLFNKKTGLHDPFAKPLNVMTLPIVGELVSDIEFLTILAEFYFKRGFYSDALPLLDKLSGMGSTDQHIMEKIGFCYQSDKNYIMAEEAYGKAALLGNPGPWLLNKLAYVNRKLGNYNEAARYYERCLEMAPENVSFMMHAGNMLVESGDIAGALTYFHHANYLKSDEAKILRAIAWAELLNGNYSKSMEYNMRIISKSPCALDYLNAGHASLLGGDVKEAVNFYRLSVSMDKNTYMSGFKSDMEKIISRGVSRDTLMVIQDIVLNPM